MNVRKITAILLALVMLVALTACGGNNTPSGNAPVTGGGDSSDPTIQRYETTRDIYVGEWWTNEISYFSGTTEVPADEGNPLTGQMRLDNIRAIEERYNVRFWQVDMTWDGIRESINTSIMAGTPDVDIYAVDMQFAIPPVINNWCMPISSFTTPDDDINTNNIVFTQTNLCMLPENYIFRPSPFIDPNAVFTLGFNWDLLQERGITENPQDLWDAGEWTWDKWLEMMQQITDTSKPSYGWGGDHVRMFTNLLISNGAGVCISETQQLTSPETMEVLNFIYDMYNTYNVARPWQDPPAEHWTNNSFNDGTLGFFVFAPWLAQESRFGVSKSEQNPYDIRAVPWPIGPSGNKETNATANLEGTWYMIPKGTKDANIVYKVFFDYSNWYDYDTELRDDWTWMEDLYAHDTRGWEYAKWMCTKPQADLWGFLGMKTGDESFYVSNLLHGTEEPSQFAERWKNVVQDYIDIAYGKK